MPKCPECKKEITHLYQFSRCTEKCWVALNKEREIEAEPVEIFYDDNEEDYECPECCEVLFHIWNDAERFLQGKEE